MPRSACPHAILAFVLGIKVDQSAASDRAWQMPEQHHDSLQTMNAFNTLFPLSSFVLVVAMMIAIVNPSLTAHGEQPKSRASIHWDFDASDVSGILLKGESSLVQGVSGKTHSLDGRSLFVVEHSSAPTHGPTP